MSNRRTLQHLDKVLRDQNVAPVSVDQYTTWPAYGDMTSEQMLAWGRAEQQQRIEDLKDRTPEGLRAAQARAEQRRKAIGAGRSVAATLCMDASRADRIAKGRGIAA